MLTSVAARELPRHLGQLPGGSHVFLAAGFTHDGEPVMYALGNVIDSFGAHRYVFQRLVMSPGLVDRPPRLQAVGTGGVYLEQTMHLWKRALLAMLEANEAGRVSDLAVADRLAQITHTAHRGVTDGTVGPSSIVMWRRPPQDVLPGGGYQAYLNGARDSNEGVRVPMVSNGLDFNAVLDAFVSVMPSAPEMRAGLEAGIPAEDLMRFDVDELNRRWAQLPDQPDEGLR